EVQVYKVGQSGWPYIFGLPEGLALWPRPVKTDAQGRFTIKRVGRGEQVSFVVGDDRFDWQTTHIAPADRGKEITQTLSPARMVEGRVLYEDTGKPVVKADVALALNAVTRARTDRNGHFRLNLPAAAGNNLVAYPPEGEPYLILFKRITWPSGTVR